MCDAFSWWWPCRVSWVLTAVLFFPSEPLLSDVIPIISFLFLFSFFPLSPIRAATLAPAPHGLVQTDSSSHLMGKKILMCRSYLKWKLFVVHWRTNCVYCFPLNSCEWLWQWAGVVVRADESFSGRQAGWIKFIHLEANLWLDLNFCSLWLFFGFQHDDVYFNTRP